MVYDSLTIFFHKSTSGGKNSDDSKPYVESVLIGRQKVNPPLIQKFKHAFSKLT